MTFWSNIIYFDYQASEFSSSVLHLNRNHQARLRRFFSQSAHIYLVGDQNIPKSENRRVRLFQKVWNFICFAWRSIILDSTSSFIWCNSFNFRSNRSCEDVCCFVVPGHPFEQPRAPCRCPRISKVPKELDGSHFPFLMFSGEASLFLIFQWYWCKNYHLQLPIYHHLLINKNTSIIFIFPQFHVTCPNYMGRWKQWMYSSQ